LNYLFFSRIIYTLPFLIYCGLNFKEIFANQSTGLFTILYLVVFLFSIFFFGISKKVIPTLLIHFIFLFEFYILATLATATGDHNILLFILLTSFYTIESLRNDSTNLTIHLLTFIANNVSKQTSLLTEENALQKMRTASLKTVWESVKNDSW